MLPDNVDATDVLFVKDIILITVPLLSLCATIPHSGYCRI